MRKVKGVDPFDFTSGGNLPRSNAMGLSLNVVEIGLTAKEIIPWRN